METVVIEFGINQLLQTTLPLMGLCLCPDDFYINQISRLDYVVYFDMAMRKFLLQFHACF